MGPDAEVRGEYAPEGEARKPAAEGPCEGPSPLDLPGLLDQGHA